MAWIALRGLLRDEQTDVKICFRYCFVELKVSDSLLSNRVSILIDCFLFIGYLLLWSQPNVVFVLFFNYNINLGQLDHSNHVTNSMLNLINN